tara:strand:- start:906 stop:1298 length:393 start_codon:yes stop_codon:yes gene_type:complete
MDIIDDKYTKKGTWIKDGVLMCNKDCCGAPVSECSCDSSCKKCNCYNLKEEGVTERYGMRPGVAQSRDSVDDVMNMNKRNQNRALDQGREANIKAASAQRLANKRARKIATAMPQRILNPQQPQAPTGQS